MEFVAQRVNDYQQERDPEPPPAQQVMRRIAKRSRGQDTENGVLGKVTRLTPQKLDYPDRGFAGMGKQPEDRPQENAAGV